MIWALWLAGAVILFVPGAYVLRRGKLKIVRAYFIACAVAAVCWAFGLGPLLGETLAAWPKMLLAMLIPGTVVLAIMATQRDRKRVMGNPRDRDAIASAAVIYGAGAAHTTEVAGDTSGGGDAGDAGGGGF